MCVCGCVCVCVCACVCVWLHISKCVYVGKFMHARMCVCVCVCVRVCVRVRLILSVGRVCCAQLYDCGVWIYVHLGL